MTTFPFPVFFGSIWHAVRCCCKQVAHDRQIRKRSHGMPGRPSARRDCHGSQCETGARLARPGRAVSEDAASWTPRASQACRRRVPYVRPRRCAGSVRCLAQPVRVPGIRALERNIVRGHASRVFRARQNPGRPCSGRDVKCPVTHPGAAPDETRDPEAGADTGRRNAPTAEPPRGCTQRRVNRAGHEVLPETGTQFLLRQ